MDTPISLFGGTGFVGSAFRKVTEHKFELVPREQRKPISDNILFLISTTHNYNVFTDIQIDTNVNIKILLEVLDHMRESKGVLNFVSSWFVYGDTNLPATEESVCSPKGFYSITKRTAEQLLISFCETFGLHYRILRLCNVYGPGDAGVSKQKNALQFLIEKIKNSEEISLYHDGLFFRDYMHVDDVARAIDCCLAKAPLNSVTNIGTGQKILFRDLIDRAVLLTNSRSKIGTMAVPEFHKTVQVKDFYMNCDRLKSLGFVPQISLEEGLKELCR